MCSPTWPLWDHIALTCHDLRPDRRLYALALAVVHLADDGDTTIFRVHGGGLIIGRVVNELGIARKVRATLRDSLR